MTNQIKSAAASKTNSENFLVAAKNESDKYN